MPAVGISIISSADLQLEVVDSNRLLLVTPLRIVVKPAEIAVVDSVGRQTFSRCSNDDRRRVGDVAGPRRRAA
jgi:hypothetical protein